MRDIQHLYDWLLENGGVYIQLILNVNQPVNNNLISTLLELEEVKKLFTYLEAFNTDKRDKKNLEHLIHYYKD